MNYLNTEGPYRLFQNVVNSEIFVDKSMMIREISKAGGIERVSGGTIFPRSSAVENR